MVAGPEVDNGQASGLEAQYNRYNRYVHTKRSNRTEPVHLQDPGSICTSDTTHEEPKIVSLPKSQAGTAETRPKKQFDWLRNI